MATSVSEHRKSGQFAAFKKMIGGHRFYFGEAWGIVRSNADSRKLAQKAAALLEREYDALKLTEGGWNALNRPAALNRVRTILGLATESTPTQTLPAAPEAARTNQNADQTIAEAIVSYKAAQNERFATKKISDKRLESIKERMEAAKVGFADLSVPLSSVRREQLEAAINYHLKRPTSAKTGKPISPKTVAHRVQTLGHFFRWAYDNERWDAPRAWDSLFKVDEQSLMNATEKHQSKQPKEKFTADELAILYANATSRTRLYILLGLNCGMGQSEQATLRKWDLLLTNKPPIIDRQRNKTGVQGRWELWDETVTLLKRFVGGNDFEAFYVNNASKENEAFADTLPNFKDHKPAKYERPVAVEDDDTASLLLKTEDGYPLVHGNTDAVNSAWARLYTHPNVKKAMKAKRLRKLSFYTLRRTAAQFVFDIAGLQTAQVFAAQSTLAADGRKTVLEAHYAQRSNADFSRVADATHKLREHLQPMFDAKAEAVQWKKPGPKPKPNAAPISNLHV